MRGLTRPRHRAGRAPRLAGAAALAALIGGAGGCYTFAPVPTPATAAVPADAYVRVALSDAGASALQPVGGESVRAIEGPLVRQAGDTVVVRADRLLTTVAGVDVTWTRGEIAVPAPWRTTVERRHLARGRTALLVGGGVALSAGILALVRALGDAQGDAGGGPPPGLSRRR